MIEGKKMTLAQSRDEWRSLALQEKVRADLAEAWVVSLRADLARADSENRYWRDNRWWARLLRRR